MTTALRRTLGTTDLTLLVIGNVIGSGIFLVPSAVLSLVGGRPSTAALVWLLGGVLSLLGALSYAELGAMHRGSGGLYAYIRDGFGPFPAFLYGWTLFFVIGTGTVATLAVAASNYMGQFADLGPVARRVIAVALIVLMAAINVRGTRQSASVQNVATGVKVGAILVMSALLLTLGERDAWAPAGGTGADGATSLVAVGVAMIAVLWAYEGWQYVTFADAEAVDPQRMLPRAIALGTAALIAIYLIANVAYLAALGADGVAGSTRVAGEAVGAVLGPLAGRLVAVAIIISMYSAAHATVITAPRVYLAMGRDGQFFTSIDAVHPRFGTPAIAIVASCAWSAVLAVTGTFEQLLTYVVFVGWIFYGLGAAAVISLRRKRPGAERPFRVPGYPATPLLFVGAALAIVGNTIFAQPGQSAIGIGMVLLGLPAYRWASYPDWYPRVFRKYFDFSGRASRKEYWTFFFWYVVAGTGVGVAEGLAGLAPMGQPGVLSLAYTMAVIIPGAAVGVRRMHDAGWSGWTMLIPAANLYALLLPGQRGDNRYGEPADAGPVS